MSPNILLINTNIARPPVSPVGLEYLGEALVEAGKSVRILDLAFESDWQKAIRRELNSEPRVIGMTVRNTDDCSFSSGVSFLPWIREITSKLRDFTSASIVLGGVGFSVMPELVIKATGADFGIAGDGEEATLALINCLINREDISSLPNLVFRHENTIIINSRLATNINRLPLPRRRLFDNKRYEQSGAMVGIETKRGCSQRCIYCADPIAKGNRIRLRSPDTVVEEFKDLTEQAISWFHLCDSEFNLPIKHAKEVCKAIIRAGLGEKIRWYCYCTPTPFDEELGRLMRHAGCFGINFGVDAICDDQLLRLKRSHSVADISSLANLLRKEGLNYIFDLLIGGPGETKETLQTTINQTRKLNIPLVGIAAGVRVYPGTPLSNIIASGLIKKGITPSGFKAIDYIEPIFFLSPHLGNDISGLISELIADDPRFLFLGKPSQSGSYNYANDDGLYRIIEEGARGAYWDIIQQQRGAVHE